MSAGWTNAHDLVRVEHSGRLDVDKIKELEYGEDDILALHLHQQEFVTRMLLAKEAYLAAVSREGEVRTGCRLHVINDMTGFGRKHMSGDAYGITRAIMENDGLLYPETLRSATLVNAPFLFNIAFKVTSVWMDKATRKKITVTGGSGKKPLRKSINEPHCIPKQLTGACEHLVFEDMPYMCDTDIMRQYLDLCVTGLKGRPFLLNPGLISNTVLRSLSGVHCARHSTQPTLATIAELIAAYAV